MDNSTNPSFFGLQIKQLIDFAKQPDNAGSALSFKEKLRAFSVLFLFNLIVIGVIMGLLSVIEPFLPKELMQNHKVSELFNSNIWIILLLTAVLAPVWEELVFRFPLKFRPWVIHTLIGLLFVFAGVKLAFSKNLTVQVAGGIILLPLFVLYLIKIKCVASFFSRVWKDRFGAVFYTFTMCFALIHIANYPFVWVTFLALPVLILPQFTIGVVMGYIRVRFGILWSIVFHALHNGLFVTLAIVMMTTVFNKPVEIKNTEYSLNINKYEPYEFEASSSMVGQDSIVIVNHKFHDVLSILLNKNRKFIAVDDDKADVKLYLKLARIKPVKDSAGAINKNIETVLDEMKKAYGFTFDTIHKNVVNYEMYIKDNDKLKKYLSTKKGITSTEKNSKRVLIKNNPIKTVADNLNEDFEEVKFGSAINSKAFYTLEYPVLSLNKTLDYLETYFGLGFKESEKDVEMVKVKFTE